MVSGIGEDRLDEAMELSGVRAAVNDHLGQVTHRLHLLQTDIYRLKTICCGFPGDVNS
jgi:hypothetical protein